MKILALSNCPLVASQGSGYVVLNYAEGLRALGHEVDCHGPETFESLKGIRRARRWRIALGLAWFAIRRGGFREYDLIEFYGAESWLAILLLRLARTRSVLIHHSNGLETLASKELIENSGADTFSGTPRRWYQLRGNALLTLSFTQVDALALVSHWQRRFASAAGYQPDARTLAIETPLPAEFLNLALECDRPLTIGYCGSWLRYKGIEILVPAVIELLRKHPHWSFRMVGAGSAFSRDEDFPLDLRERIEVVPFLAQKSALRDWYRQVSILLVPSYSESFCLVVSESMACGCAVVASRTGFAADLVDGEEVLVVPDFSVAGFVSSTERLIRDDGLRRRIAAAGHARVQRLQWADACATLDRFYSGLRVRPGPSGWTRSRA